MEIDLIRAKPQDIEAVLPLVAAFHAEEGVEQAAEIRRAAVETLLANPSFGEIWLIRATGALAGYLAFAFGFSIEFAGRDAFLDELYVSPEHRRRGIGRLALKHLIAHLKETDVKAAHLEVELDNFKAQKLYASEGFELRQRYHLMSARI